LGRKLKPKPKFRCPDKRTAKEDCITWAITDKKDVIVRLVHVVSGRKIGQIRPSTEAWGDLIRATQRGEFDFVR
jgi:hypothetical protein